MLLKPQTISMACKNLEMTTETTTLLECIPEFDDEVFIGYEKYYRIIIILSADVSRVIYISNKFVTKELRTWIDKWKEV